MGLFEDALTFAAERHCGQTRRGSDAPYILHPMEAAAIVGTMTDDVEILSAAILHNTVEDTDTTLSEIRERFGKRVSLLVMTETEDKREGISPEDTWEIRKEETLAILENTKDTGVKMMWLGDKLSNMRSFARLYRAEGIGFIDRFHQKDPRRQAWYYTRIAECLSSLKEYDAYREFVSLVEYVFNDYMDRGDL